MDGRLKFLITGCSMVILGRLNDPMLCIPSASEAKLKGVGITGLNALSGSVVSLSSLRLTTRQYQATTPITRIICGCGDQDLTMNSTSTSSTRVITSEQSESVSQPSTLRVYCTPMTKVSRASSCV